MNIWVQRFCARSQIKESVSQTFTTYVVGNTATYITFSTSILPLPRTSLQSAFSVLSSRYLIFCLPNAIENNSILRHVRPRVFIRKLSGPCTAVYVTFTLCISMSPASSCPISSLSSPTFLPSGFFWRLLFNDFLNLAHLLLALNPGRVSAYKVSCVRLCTLQGQKQVWYR
jgi:hypothetical protein